MDAACHDRPSAQSSSITSVPDTISKPSPKQPSPETSTQAPFNSQPARRSFDQVRSPASSAQQRPSAPLAQPRPRAYSDQAPTPSSTIRPRTSLDQARPLPTLNEKPLERYDSNASVSVTEAATVPLTTLRYRPKAVNVKKPPVKHHSAPSTLPSLSGQTSLMDDLSNWVLPASARDSYQSNDSPISVITSTPSTSITSSPVLTHSPTSSPGIVKGIGHAVVPPVTGSSPTSVSTTPASQSTHTYIAFRPPLRAPPPVPYVAAGTDTSKDFVPAIPLEVVRNAMSPGRRDNEESVSNTATVAHDPIAVGKGVTPRPIGPQTSITEESTVSTLQEVSVPDHQYCVSPESTEAVAQKVAESSAAEVPVAKVKAPASTPSSPTRISSAQSNSGTSKPTIPTVPSQPAVSAVAPPTAPVATSSQPMTAQARRRAAHARRMQAAFGAEHQKGTEEGTAQ
jgi:hypothetical protein